MTLSRELFSTILAAGRAASAFERTNRIVGNRDLIRVAVTRTPDQAIPLSGRYWGRAEDQLAMDVSVNQNARQRARDAT